MYLDGLVRLPAPARPHQAARYGAEEAARRKRGGRVRMCTRVCVCVRWGGGVLRRRLLRPAATARQATTPVDPRVLDAMLPYLTVSVRVSTQPQRSAAALAARARL